MDCLRRWRLLSGPLGDYLLLQGIVPSGLDLQVHMGYEIVYIERFDLYVLHSLLDEAWPDASEDLQNASLCLGDYIVLNEAANVADLHHFDACCDAAGRC